VTLRDTAALLARVFPEAPRISHPEYLRWLYEDSPFGPVVEANLDDAEGRAGHYALVPVDLVEDGRPARGALSLNTAVDERARGGGVFVRLAEEAIASARERGVATIVGVANANSTPGFVRRLSFELVGALPATILLPLPGRGGRVRSAWAEEDPLRPGGAMEDGLDGLLKPPQRGLSRDWTPETLRWRLASPGSRYALHRSENMLAVTIADTGRRPSFAVLLKAFAQAPPSAAERRAVIRAACRLHRAPLAVHVGLNDMVAFDGLPLPARLRPSPLNLIVRHLDDTPAAGPVARFEFLDFDAY
jgi:GNAT superfamily N-acetyltransferase